MAVPRFRVHLQIRSGGTEGLRRLLLLALYRANTRSLVPVTAVTAASIAAVVATSVTSFGIAMAAGRSGCGMTMATGRSGCSMAVATGRSGSSLAMAGPACGRSAVAVIVVAASSAAIAGSDVTAIAAPTSVAEAMAAPAVVISPVCPWSHAQENTVVEVTRPVVSVRGAAIGRIAVITVGTDRRRTADANRNLCVGLWYQCQRHEQHNCCT